MKILTETRPACNAGTPGQRASATGRHAVQSGRKSSDLGGSLGINTKYKNNSTLAPQKVDPETGEITGFDPMASTVERYMLQSVARGMLPKSRTAKCMRVKVSKQLVQVWKSNQHKSAHYVGLMACGSIWTCPVCAAKISERRRVEVKQAMDAHKAAGGCVNLLTLTCPHQRTDDLAVLLPKQAKALNRFWSDRTTKAILAEMGTIGQIRGTEATHGRLSPQNNGWHPHYHVLMFQGIGVDLTRFDQAQMMDWQVRLYLQWVKACKAAGLGEPSFAHGLKLDGGDKAEKYLTKWGLEHELTKGHIKKAISGETPFDLLRSYLADSTDKQAAALFIEYANAFKGKRQLHWSKGLKKRYAVTEKSDIELATATEDKCSYLSDISDAQWRDVLAVNGRAIVLQVAASGGSDALAVYLESIKGKGAKP